MADRVVGYVPMRGEWSIVLHLRSCRFHNCRASLIWREQSSQDERFLPDKRSRSTQTKGHYRPLISRFAVSFPGPHALDVDWQSTRKGDSAMYQSCLKALSTLILVSVAVPVFSQVVPDIKERAHPFRVGVGYSNYGSDFNGVDGRGGRLGGPTAWIDFDVPKLPPAWSGFQIEAEGRDLNYNRTGKDPTLRQYSVAGGVNYAWRYDAVFHPYVKFLTGIGNVDFQSTIPYYRKDSRTFYAPAGGIEVRAYGRL